MSLLESEYFDQNNKFPAWRLPFRYLRMTFSAVYNGIYLLEEALIDVKIKWKEKL